MSRFISSRCACAALLAASAGAFAGAASAVTLYDPGLNSLPSDQQWFTAGLGSYTQTVAGGHYLLDTSANNADRAGSELLQPALLNTVTGFTLDFALRIAAESHAADNQRAGFSLIVTGTDPRHALEIGFWENSVFAYGASFVPGAATTFATASPTDYSLLVADNQYSLLGNGNLLLAGALIDYTALPVPPYTTPAALFFGDDTTRARSVSELGLVTLTTAVPEPASWALMGAGLLGLAWRRRRRTAPSRQRQVGLTSGRGLPELSIAT